MSNREFAKLVKAAFKREKDQPKIKGKHPQA